MGQAKPVLLTAHRAMSGDFAAIGMPVFSVKLCTEWLQVQEHFLAQDQMKKRRKSCQH